MLVGSVRINGAGFVENAIEQLFENKITWVYGQAYKKGNNVQFKGISAGD